MFDRRKSFLWEWVAFAARWRHLAADRFLQAEDDDWVFFPQQSSPLLPLPAALTARHVAAEVMRAAPAAGSQWLHGAEDERGAGDSLRGVRTAQEGALRRRAFHGLRHAHIHHPGSLCEYNAVNASNIPTEFVAESNFGLNKKRKQRSGGEWRGAECV